MENNRWSKPRSHQGVVAVSERGRAQTCARDAIIARCEDTQTETRIWLDVVLRDYDDAQ